MRSHRSPSWHPRPHPHRHRRRRPPPTTPIAVVTATVAGVPVGEARLEHQLRVVNKRVLEVVLVLCGRLSRRPCRRRRASTPLPLDNPRRARTGARVVDGGTSRCGSAGGTTTVGSSSGSGSSGGVPVRRAQRVHINCDVVPIVRGIAAAASSGSAAEENEKLSCAATRHRGGGKRREARRRGIGGERTKEQSSMATGRGGEKGCPSTHSHTAKTCRLASAETSMTHTTRGVARTVPESRPATR